MYIYIYITELPDKGGRALGGSIIILRRAVFNWHLEIIIRPNHANFE